MVDPVVEPAAPAAEPAAAPPPPPTLADVIAAYKADGLAKRAAVESELAAAARIDAELKAAMLKADDDARVEAFEAEQAVKERSHAEVFTKTPHGIVYASGCI